MYRQWDWEQLTTVAWNTDPHLICLAHQHGARVVVKAELPANRTLLESAVYRAEWVSGSGASRGVHMPVERLAAPLPAYVSEARSRACVVLLLTRRVVAGLLQVQARLDEAGVHHTDGVNFDLEDPAGPGSPLARAYTALVAETAAAFHKRDPAAQVPCAAGARGVDYGLHSTASKQCLTCLAK